MKRRCIATVVSFVLALGIGAAARAAEADGDAFAAGYAGAVLEREFKTSARSLRVERGVLSVDAADLGAADRTRLTGALSRIPGITRIDIRESGTGQVVAVEDRPAPRLKVLEEYEAGVLPGGQLFRPLIADPRWPHFAVAHQYYLNDPDFGNVAAVSFGETFTLYRNRIGAGWWETGIQAGVFAVFDLDAESKDLINADYLGAVVLGYRRDRFSALGRLFHQSSHLGDEFLLENRVRNRVNLSYESVDTRLSYELFDNAVRLYGGGGYLFDQDPRRLQPWSLQWGVEFRSPWPGPGAVVRPIAAVDVQNREENAWHSDLSARAGVQFEGLVAGRNLQILLEYFRGHSPNGQFYKQKIDYLGVGAHFHF